MVDNLPPRAGSVTLAGDPSEARTAQPSGFGGEDTIYDLSGRVRGGRIPRAGLRLRLQSRGFGGWRTQAILRTDGLCRFSASGRAPRGARVRIVVPAQRGYLYARGVGRP